QVSSKSASSRATVDSESSNEWHAKEWVKVWAALPPELSKQDLRPYFFVARDRKAVFSTAMVVPTREAWVEALCGSTLGARAAGLEVSKLGRGEQEEIFNAVARRVAGAGDLKTKPPGIAGLIELCKVSPALQAPLVSLLESLPVSK